MTDATGFSPAQASSDALSQYVEARQRFYEAAHKANMPLPRPITVPDQRPDDGPPLPDLPELVDLTRPAGLVGAIVDWMEDTAERPNRALYLAAALTLVGTLAGRKFASATDLRTNLYCVTLAPSGHGK